MKFGDILRFVSLG